MQNQSQKHLVRLKADNIKPRYVTCVWLIFFILIGVLYLLVFAIPDASIIEIAEPFCPPDRPQPDPNPCSCQLFDFNTNPTIVIEKRKMSPKNQFYAVDLVPIKTKSSMTDKFYVSLVLEIRSFELNSDRTIKKELIKNSTHIVEFACLDPTNANCEQKTVIYQPQIKQENILLLITIKNAAQYQGRLSTVGALFQTISPKYSDFLLSLRYVCLAISALVFWYYEMKLRRLKKDLRVFEQKYIRWLGILVMLFNDPFCAITILKPNMFSAFLSSLFVVTFFCALLLFWICCFERIYRENAQVRSRILNAKKLIYISLLWLFSLVTYNILNRQYLNDPGFDFDDEHHQAFNAFKIFMIILLIIGLGWMFYGFAQIIKKYSTRIWRHKMFFSFSCYFIFCYFLFLFTGSLQTYNDNGTRVMLVFGVSNIYIWFLEFLYSPTDQGIQETEQIEKVANPGSLALSYEMLDESAHDGFGSDNHSIDIKKLEDVQNEEDNDDRVIHNPDQIIFGLDDIVNKDPEEEQDNSQNKYPFELKNDDEE